MIETQSYVRKSFPVEAIQVTAENMAEVAAWCGGEVKQTNPKPGPKGPGSQKSYIWVDVQHPKNDRQRMAFPKDWVVKAATGFKVYMDRAFGKSFELAETSNGLDPMDADTNGLGENPESV